MAETLTVRAFLLRWLRRTLIALVLLLALGVLLLVRCTAPERARRAAIYGYDVTLDSPLAFADDAPRLEIEIGSSDLRWPLGRGECHSAFLRLKLDGHRLARYIEPALRVEAPGVPAFDQYFERGMVGARWANVSPLCALDEGATVRLAGEQLDVVPGRGEIVYFPDPELGQGPLLVVAPHPDDAEIAAFGLYREMHSYIVNVTAGDYPGRWLDHLAATREERARLRGRLRVWDSFAVPLFGGVPTERVVNLGYGNGLLAEMRARPTEVAGQDRGGSETVRDYRRQIPSPLLPDRQAQGTWVSLVEDLADIVARVAPAVIATPHPVLDVSEEHRLSTEALLEALERLGDSRVLLLLYTNHAGTEFFPYGPADGLVSLPRPREPYTLRAAVSIPLSPDAVRDKLLALDAMHDLRKAPHPMLGEATMRELRALRRMWREWWFDPHDYYSYLRRAARPNEVFFPVRVEERGSLPRSSGTSGEPADYGSMPSTPRTVRPGT